MTNHAKKIESTCRILAKNDGATPALIVTGPDSIAVKAGTVFTGIQFTVDTAVKMPEAGLEPGADYGVLIGPDVEPSALKLIASPESDVFLGGFHFAPGSNASARAGGDSTPAINPYSVWDLNFRPACADPRGMTLVQKPGGQFWCDIYLTGANHDVDGTSKFGVTIADGDDRPKVGDKKVKAFDYATASTVLALHGKGLLSVDEFFAAAYGVTEKTSRKGDAETTQLDAPRTSKWGVMQATGNMWVWGHDGDPDTPRASMFGGSWWYGDFAGSRYADVDYWDDNSHGHLGARGRSDHLQLD